MKIEYDCETSIINVFNKQGYLVKTTKGTYEDFVSICCKYV